MIDDPTFVGLVTAACVRPDDDTPRMVLADFLDDFADNTADPEAASAWAAYIRWDCGGRKGEEPDGLLRVVELGGWFGVARVSRTQSLMLSRGFPGGLCTPWDAWETVGHLLSWHPSEYEKSGRACPPTACPGVEVTIRGDTIVHGYRLQESQLSERWPGVMVWHLPDVRRAVEDFQQVIIDQLRRYNHILPTMLGPTAGNYAAAEAVLRTFNERTMYDGPLVPDIRTFLHTDPADTEE